MTRSLADLLFAPRSVVVLGASSDPDKLSGRPLDYLKKLNEYYNKWIDTYAEGPLLIINGDLNKFGEKDEDLGKVINMVDAQLFGLF